MVIGRTLICMLISILFAPIGLDVVKLNYGLWRT